MTERAQRYVSVVEIFLPTIFLRLTIREAEGVLRNDIATQGGKGVSDADDTAILPAAIEPSTKELSLVLDQILLAEDGFP